MASRHFLHFSRGRYALHEAYRLAGLSSGSTLLAPAYHCVTMLDPALHLGAGIHLYPLHDDLSPDTDQLDAVLHAAKKPVRALLATHFFGFPQDFSRLQDWCKQHEISLIEDCSHVLFTPFFQAPACGLYGKFVAASPYKFFPCDDGGLLYAQDASDLGSLKTHSAGLVAELRGIKHVIEHSWNCQHTPGGNPNLHKPIEQQLAALASSPCVRGVDTRVHYGQATRQFSAADRQNASLKSSQFIVKHTPVAALARCRQSNYRRLAKAVEDLPQCRALYPDLPENVIPYMFPLLIDAPEPHFYWLKKLGFPIWRWDEMAVSECAIAAKYRDRLLHLPCHQSLSNEQMDWMIAALSATLRTPTSGRQP